MRANRTIRLIPKLAVLSTAAAAISFIIGASQPPNDDFNLQVTQNPGIGILTDGSSYLKSHLIIKLKPGIRVENLNADFGGSVLRFLDQSPQTGWILVETADMEATVDVFNVLRNSDKIEAIEFNKLGRISGTFYSPNDPKKNKQWYLDKIKAKQAWDIERGDTGIWIGIIDSGIPYDEEMNEFLHPELTHNAQRRISLNNRTDHYLYPAIWPSGEWIDDNTGHGTTIAGIIAAATDNGEGIAGLIHECSLYISKVSDNAAGHTCYWGVSQAIIHTTDWIRTHGGKGVINLSIGSSHDSSGVWRDAVEYADSYDILISAGIGNCGSVDYPAIWYADPSIKNIISVGASTRNDELPPWSAGIPGIYAVSVVAPGGEHIWPDTPREPDDIYSTKPPDTYGWDAGTSFATPMVTSLAALIYAIDQQATPESVIDYIEANADDILAPGRDYNSGYGRINMYETLNDVYYNMWLPVVDIDCHFYPSCVYGVPNEGNYGPAPDYTFTKGPIWRGEDPEVKYRFEVWPPGQGVPEEIKLRVTYFTPNDGDDPEMKGRAILAPPGSNQLQQSLYAWRWYDKLIHGPLRVYTTPQSHTYFLDDSYLFDAIPGGLELHLNWYYEEGAPDGEEVVWATVSRIEVWVKRPGGGGGAATDILPTESQACLLEVAQNYPNPFNPNTTIAFRLNQNAKVKVTILNTRGQLVRNLHDGLLTKGEHRLVWDSTNQGGTLVGSGVYFALIESGQERHVVRMLLVK